MKKSISILKAIKSKPSVALQHMVDGLLKQSRRKDFIIDMGTFGSTDSKICYGCAATCTIQSIAKVTLFPLDIYYAGDRARKAKADMDELRKFEEAIDCARRGWMFTLFRFCEVEYVGTFDGKFDLRTDDWRQQLPEVRETISKLKKAGY